MPTTQISASRKGLLTADMMTDGDSFRPGLAFRSNPGCGLYRISEDKIGLITGADPLGGLVIDGGKIGFNVASPTAQFQIGWHSGTTAGAGTTISETATGAARFYADDGGVAIGTAAGSVPDVKNLQARTLITVDNSSFDARVHSIMGQLKSQNGEWGDEQWSAVHGYVELVRTAGTITFQSYGVTAGLMATVETAGNLGIAATHNLAGVAAISKLGYSGTFTDNTNTSGVYVGMYDSTNWSDSPSLDKWNHGLYVQAKSVDKGFQIGELSSSTQVGLTLVAATGTSGADVFTDDGNVALGGGTPFKGFRSRTMFFQDQTAGTTVMGVLGQLKYASGVDIGPARVAAVEGYNELMTTNKAKSGGYIVGVSSVTEVSAGTFTIESGGICAGFHAKLTGSGTATQDATGILTAIYINEDVSTGTWGFAIAIDGADNVFRFNTGTAYEDGVKVTNGLAGDGGVEGKVGFDALMRCYIGATAYYVAMYDAGSVTGE